MDPVVLSSPRLRLPPAKSKSSDSIRQKTREKMATPTTTYFRACPPLNRLKHVPTKLLHCLGLSVARSLDLLGWRFLGVVGKHCALWERVFDACNCIATRTNAPPFAVWPVLDTKSGPFVWILFGWPWNSVCWALDVGCFVGWRYHKARYHTIMPLNSTMFVIASLLAPSVCETETFANHTNVFDSHYLLHFRETCLFNVLKNWFNKSKIDVILKDL